MSYTPVVPFSGQAGWAFLQRTLPSQKKAFLNSPEATRDAAYFRANIGNINSAAELVADRRLLKVALGAFGLEGDLNNKAFIRKILEDGTLKTGALANRLTDKRYAQMSAAFGFGDSSTPRTKHSDFADKIIPKWETRQFEIAVGNSNENMRLALNAARELPEIARKSGSEATRWYAIMGNPPLRSVLQTALGLPSSFSSIDLDQQLTVFKERAARSFGESDPAKFGQEGSVQKVISHFLARAEISNTPAGGASAALTLLANLR